MSNSTDQASLPPVPPQQETSVATGVVFNVLHPDGVFRPMRICQGDVKSVQKLDPPYKIDNAEAHTAIKCKECDTFAGFGKAYEIYVYEEIYDVLGALGSRASASMWKSMHCFYAGGHFASQGIKYAIE